MESESSSRRLGNFGLLGDSKYIGVIDSTTFRAKDLNLSQTLISIDIFVRFYCGSNAEVPLKINSTALQAKDLHLSQT